MLFIHFILPIFPETRRLKIPQTANRKYVGAPSRMNHKLILTCNSSGRKFGRKTWSDAMEESSVPEVCFLQCLHGNSRWTLRGFSLIFQETATRKS